MATPVTARRLRMFTNQQQQLPSETSTASPVRVVVRIRPFLPSEVESFGDGNPAPCVSVASSLDDRSGGEVTVQIKDQFSSRSECYKLDSVFGLDEDLGAIFRQEVATVVPGLFMGFNSTVFAYGATGSGKTYTMQGTDENPGIVSLALSNIFSKCQEPCSSVAISYYEIYMDRCYDLLEPKASEIMVLEDANGQVQLKGLCKVPVRSMAEFHEVFSSAIQRRKVAYTGLNDVSSRSHGILSVVVSDGYVKGKLNLIDLAGNEDNRRTCNQGLRLQESAKINQSLFALSNVIYALNNNEPRVPYRDSKLTRILQDSLGGTSRALMIACLNPGSYQEAVHTVSLAARSRHIVNYVDSEHKLETPKAKVDMEAKLRAWLESKGKVKSLHRINGCHSPFLGKTPPSSVNTSKKLEVVSSSTLKPKSNAKPRNNAKDLCKESIPRKLFDSAARALNSTTPAIDSANEKLLLNERIVAVNSPACLKTTSPWKETSSCSLDFECPLDKSDSCREFTNVEENNMNQRLRFEEAEEKLLLNERIVAVNSPTCLNATSPWKETSSCSIDVECPRDTSDSCREFTNVEENNLNQRLRFEEAEAEFSCDGKLDGSWGRGSHETKADDINKENLLLNGRIVAVNSSTCHDTISPWNKTSSCSLAVECPLDISASCGEFTNVEEKHLHQRLQFEEVEEKFSYDGILNGSRGRDSHEMKRDDINEDFYHSDRETIVTHKNYVQFQTLPMIKSPQRNDSIQELQSSIRKVLSPMNSNSSCMISLESKTPKTPVTHKRAELQEDTPLSKFSSQSTNLKESLAKEYIAFLNVANKEELMALKGVGEKRAECILKLREQSPLKSLSDLEKMGLSCKQTNDLLRKAARGIFA